MKYGNEFEDRIVSKWRMQFGMVMLQITKSLCILNLERPVNMTKICSLEI